MTLAPRSGARNTIWAVVALSVFSGLRVPPLRAQTTPGVYAITNAKIYTLAGPPIEKGIVIIRDGKIAAVGTNVEIPEGARIVQAAGMELYPGLFDPVTQIGLTEIGAVSATNDTNELGKFNPEIVAATAVNPASAHIGVTRASGITHVVSVPGIASFDSQSGGIIPGQASAFHLLGWTMDEMQIRRSIALTLNWPSIQTRTFDFSIFDFKEKPYADAKKEYEQSVNELGDLLDRARHYAQAKEKGSPASYERDLKLEALVPVVEGKLPVLVVAAKARDIRNAVEFCTKQGLKMILADGAEAWKVEELLKEKAIPVILGPSEQLPDEDDDPYDKPMTLPAELNAAGIPIAFSSFGTSFSRRLSQYAGTAVAFGLPHDEALKAITVNAAKMLGLGDQFGTIEAGKVANLLLTDGDPLEIRTQVRLLFINGQQTSTDNRHLDLYGEYRKRPAAPQQ
ncbi:MAG TPA: amidohydrolase family protein [Candidatus Sulfotelmatobacter sp.]|nr:amidohydrolase family protein [Candidatus Sulfotelmatobacter sp.]